VQQHLLRRPRLWLQVVPVWLLPVWLLLMMVQLLQLVHLVQLPGATPQAAWWALTQLVPLEVEEGVYHQ